MALAKERTAATESFFGNLYGGQYHSDISVFGFDNYSKMITEDEDGLEKTGGSVKNYVVNRLPAADDNSNIPSSVMFDQNMNSSPEEELAHESVINFKGAGGGYDNWIHSSGSLLSFEQGDHRVFRYPKISHDDEYPNWEGVMDNNNPRLSEDLNSFETTSSTYTANKGGSRHGEDRFGWLYSGDGSDESIQEAGCPETNYHNKRPHSDGETQANKKHCSGAPKKPKSSNKSIPPSKDPQSIAAKNRRERISERLKILQDLVPNGAKVDLVTMLEKAISYVKFLQLQVKVLATDEFWPAQGGKAPEVAQVKEAIDAILSSHHSHRDRNSSSK